MATDHEDQMLDYRKCLQTLEQQMQSDYDKAVMALSGGAFGVSMTFLNDVVSKPLSQNLQGGNYLLGAWICWGVSITCVVFSFFLSALAMRRAVKQVDRGTIFKSHPGGRSDKWTNFLNVSGGILFL